MALSGNFRLAPQQRAAELARAYKMGRRQASRLAQLKRAGIRCKNAVVSPRVNRSGVSDDDPTMIEPVAMA